MSARELVVLGTASQMPTRYRNHNGYLLRWDDEAVLFDPGEGTQRHNGVIEAFNLDEPHRDAIHRPRP